MVATDLNKTNGYGSDSVLKLYPNPEKMPDEPYFTKEIFLNMCLSDAKKLAVTRGLLSFTQIDQQVMGIIQSTIDTIMENQETILYGVMNGQITFVNKAGKGEMNEPNRK
ncbi:hypothetical protein [Streptococcus sp. 1171_SSPC]|uniref:hypothetical protein n=1 Tax=Streptococcus sp. 1171_SSPC TaxID=1579348 RepID=UPI00065F6F19|nr:hypothetical protein [Streptococcus sp. 1171_SSPC]